MRWEMLRSGQAERVLAGGYDALSQLVFSGFDALQALSPTTCRPFDARRDGLALGEGAAMLALETLESARHRGAVILGELAGYGTTIDQHHLTQPHPEGNAAAAAMTLACESARVTPEDVRLPQRARHRHAFERQFRGAGHPALGGSAGPPACRSVPRKPASGTSWAVRARSRRSFA